MSRPKNTEIKVVGFNQIYTTLYRFINDFPLNFNPNEKYPKVTHVTEILIYVLK
jgi:hypothetical protein